MLRNEADLRIDPLTGAVTVVTPWRQDRPNLPAGGCPFCPGGREAPVPYDVMCIPNRWPALPGGRHEVILHSPGHHSSFPVLGEAGTARVVELWSARTAALGARKDVGYVFVFENRGRAIGATIDHPHSQILAFGQVPPIPAAELSAPACELCRGLDSRLVVTRGPGWLAHVPWAPSWPYEMLIAPDAHVPDLPAAGPESRSGLAAILVDCLARVERLLGPAAPYMLWIHQRPASGHDWPTAHLHLHLAPVLRGPGMIRHLAAAELGAGVFFDPVDPPAAAAQLRAQLLFRALTARCQLKCETGGGSTCPVLLSGPGDRHKAVLGYAQPVTGLTAERDYEIHTTDGNPSKRVHSRRDHGGSQCRAGRTSCARRFGGEREPAPDDQLRGERRLR